MVQMGETPHDDVNGVQHDHGEPSPTGPSLDPELQFEERYGKVIAENGNLQRENLELQHELRTLEERIDRLQDSKVGTHTGSLAQLHFLRNGIGGSEGTAFRDRRSRPKNELDTRC